MLLLATTTLLIPTAYCTPNLNSASTLFMVYFSPTRCYYHFPMPSGTIIIVTAMICLTILSVIAMSLDIDGAALSAVILSIGGLAGFKAGTTYQAKRKD